jgi:hypothetical protein
MIIRQQGDWLLFITQTDHARLAGQVMAHWREDGFDVHPRREAILHAITHHDNGWLEEDADMHVDDDGNPLDFVSVPAAVKHGIWPRAVDRIGRDQPYAAALIAQHALTVHGQQRTDPLWRAFFETMDARRDALLARAGGDARATLESDYRFVQAGDQLSLIFCNGWRTPFPRRGGRMMLHGSALDLSPDPFGGARVPMRVEARRLPGRSYASAADLRATFGEAPVVMVEGEGAGTA